MNNILKWTLSQINSYTTFWEKSTCVADINKKTILNINLKFMKQKQITLFIYLLLDKNTIHILKNMSGNYIVLADWFLYVAVIFAVDLIPLKLEPSLGRVGAILGGFFLPN